MANTTSISCVQNPCPSCRENEPDLPLVPWRPVSQETRHLLPPCPLCRGGWGPRRAIRHRLRAGFCRQQDPQRRGSLLAHLCSCNEISQMGYFIRKRNVCPTIVGPGRPRPRPKAVAGSVDSEGSVSPSQTGPSTLRPHVAEEESKRTQASSRRPLWDTKPCVKDSTSLELCCDIGDSPWPPSGPPGEGGRLVW